MTRSVVKDWSSLAKPSSLQRNMVNRSVSAIIRTIVGLYVKQIRLQSLVGLVVGASVMPSAKLHEFIFML